MKAKTIVSVLLLGFVAASLAWMAVQELRNARAAEPGAIVAEAAEAETAEASPAAAPTPAPAEAEAKRTVTAYYFHGNARCVSCMKIEAYTDRAVREGFQEPLGTGLLEWRVVNVDEPGNSHFVTDYRLYTKSVVLVERRGDKLVRWKNLEQVWDLLGDEAAFVEYIHRELAAFMAEEAAA